MLMSMDVHMLMDKRLAHQGFFQIDLPKVRAAVKAECKCKFLLTDLS